MILGLQIIAVIFALAMIYLALLNYKRGELNGVEIFSWLIIWTFAIFVSVFPELLRSFAKTFLVTRVFDLMVVGAFIVVISMVAVAYLRTKKMEKKLEDLIRKDAVNRHKRNGKNR